MREKLPSAFAVILLLILTGCVERYDPGEEVLKTGTLVINAHLTDRPGVQQIEISRSTTLRFSEYEPVAGCYAALVREDGADRGFSDAGNGKYRSLLDAAFLQTGMSYRLHVITPEGNEYESDFEMLRPVPEIDSVYYQVEPDPYSEENGSQDGIRFYLDFTYDSNAYQYLRWELVETYEFHNPVLEGYIYDVDRVIKPLPDTSYWRICWITNELPAIYSMSLTYLDMGGYIRKPLNYVLNIQEEQKLHHKYSLLVKQYSVSQAAFYYWDELRKTSQEAGGLFDRQPAILQSNICNIRDGDEEVLGYFSMSGMTERRVFAENVEGIDTTPDKWYCFPIPRGPGGMGYVPRAFLPLYFARGWMDGQSYFEQVNKHCLDCRAYRNSTHIRPDFW
jgi:hypothetical protein